MRVGVFFLMLIGGLFLVVVKGSSRKYVGCFHDSKYRMFKMTKYRKHSKMTNQMCENICRKAGAEVAATQYSRYCFCGMVKDIRFNKLDHAWKIKKNRCYKRCAGDKKQICGGPWGNSVYDIRPKNTTPYKYLGCYQDHRKRMTDWKTRKYSRYSMTVDACMLYCRARGYKLAALQAGSWCSCATAAQLHKGRKSRVKARYCNRQCTGYWYGHAKKYTPKYCGGGGKNAVYDLSPKVPILKNMKNDALYDVPIKGANEGVLTRSKAELKYFKKNGIRSLKVMGFVGGSQGDIETPDCHGKIPIMRVYNKKRGHHYFSTSQKEVKIWSKAGHKREGDAGWCMKNNHQCGASLPLYRVYNKKTHTFDYTTSWRVLRQMRRSRYRRSYRVLCYIWTKRMGKQIAPQ